MGRSLAVAVLAVTGLLCAAGIGVAAYVVSRGSVAVPVTQLQLKPSRSLTPATTQTTTRTAPTTPTTTVDDHGGRSGGGGGGSSGHGGGGGGHGGDD